MPRSCNGVGIEAMKMVLTELACGIIVGIANIIPGVSGGTMALILGLYHRIIEGINNISFKTVQLFIKSIVSKSHRFKFIEEFKKIEGPLLVNLALGAAISIFLCAKLMTYLLTQHHDPTYGFFFGLVLASVATPWMLIKKKTISTFIALFIAASALVALDVSISRDDLIRKAEARQQSTLHITTSNTTSFRPIHLSEYAYYAACGALAISAMILPGISGSFVLLLLGGYFDILRAISTFDLPILFSFGLGCAVGLIGFVRFLHFLLNQYYNITMGFLLGLVIGSLWIIWPFKESVIVGTQRVYLYNTIPSQWGQNELITVGTIVVGIVLVVVTIIGEHFLRRRQ